MYTKGHTTMNIQLFVWMSRPKQLIGETKEPIKASAGKPARFDYEYRRVRGM